jgi:hypothetical protein
MAAARRLRRMMVLGSVLFLACSARSGSTAKYPEPEDGAVTNGVFQDEYFGLRYPLPEGWTEDLEGPKPSATGYYSLAALKPQGELVATMQISAQDNFFAAEPANSATEFLIEMKHHLDPTLSAPEAVRSVVIGGRHFAQLDYSGAGLEHSVFATEIRCHTLIFSITSNRSETVARVAESLKKMSFPHTVQPVSSSATTSNTKWPLCLRDLEYSDHIARRLTPVMVGPRFASVPVRLTISKDGRIEHIHAISGFPEQIKSVKDALARWEFKPYVVDGEPVEVETGLLFQFPQAQP